METKRWVALTPACLAAAICGYWLGHSDTLARNGAATGIKENSINQRIGPTEVITRTFSRAPYKERSKEELVALKKHLSHLFGSSPSATYDWALRSQVEKILASMSSAELEGFAAELAPAANESRSVDDWRNALKTLVCDVWGLKDPAGCIQKANGWGFAGWLMRDPTAARNWLQRTDLPASMEKIQNELKVSLIHQQALTDVVAASKTLGSFDPNTQQTALQRWAAMFANDAAKRTDLLAVLATLPDQETAESAYRTLIGKMAEQSPHDAALFIETMNLSEEAKDRLSHRMIGEWAVNEPEKAFNAWLEIGENEVPKTFFPALDDWSLNSPGAEAAINWVNGLEAGPPKEQFKSHMITFYCAGDRYGQAAELSKSLTDPKERILQMKTVKRYWEARGGIQKTRASEWFSKLPSDDRAAVEEPLE